MRRTSLIIRTVSPTELDIVISDLVELLRETVNGGSSLGFIPPLAHEGGRSLLFLNARHRGPPTGSTGTSDIAK
jgi:hypothetical protein